MIRIFSLLIWLIYFIEIPALASDMPIKAGETAQLPAKATIEEILAGTKHPSEFDAVDCQKRADAGHADAIYDLAQIYEYGFCGYAKNIIEARKCYVRSLVKGHIKARNALIALDVKNHSEDEFYCPNCKKCLADYVFTPCGHITCIICANKVCPLCSREVPSDSSGLKIDEVD